MSRQDIKYKIEQDYGVSINSLDTITNSINEIGYIKNCDLKSDGFYIHSEDIKVFKVGKKGYYLLENGRFDYGELYFLLDAVNSSMRLSLHDKKRLIDKLLSMGIKSDDFNKLRQMQNSIHITAPERVEKKSDYLDVLTKIGEAVHAKQCITFRHRTYITLEEDDVDKPAEIIINLTPCAIVPRPEGNIVVGFCANTFKDFFRAPIFSRDEQDPFRKGDRALYLGYVSNISDVEITDDKPYRNEEALNEIYSKMSDRNVPVVEGPINFSQLRKDRNRLRNPRYAILFSSPSVRQTIVNYFEGQVDGFEWDPTLEEYVGIVSCSTEKMLDFVVHYGDDSPANNFIVYRYWSANIGLRTDYIHLRLAQLGRLYSSYNLPFGKASWLRFAPPIFSKAALTAHKVLKKEKEKLEKIGEAIKE